MWLRKLSYERTYEAGWFLYSTRDIDHDALAEAITFRSGVQVSLRWRKITFKNNLKEPAFATHIECPEDHAAALNTWLQRTYSSKLNPDTAQLPLGMFMRRIPVSWQLISSRAIQKAIHLASRQGKFCKNVMTMTSWEIESLDKAESKRNMSLRDVLMGLKTQRNTRMFHSINPSFNGSGYIATYLPQNQEEATSIIAALPIYCRHFYGEETNNGFLLTQTTEQKMPSGAKSQIRL